MEKEGMYEEIAKSLSKGKDENWPIIIKKAFVGVKVLACNGYIISECMLRKIHNIAKKYKANYYVSSDTDGNPYVMIHL